MQNIIDICWEANSLVGPGRGSGVGFILLYVLGITQINPLREETKCFSWRFLNPERVSVLDIDFDIEGGKRADVLNAFRKHYGNDRVANVSTFRTEKSKSAILTAARGLGIDVDVAQYLSSLIPADRGQLRTLKQCFYGDEEKGFPPIKQFIIEMSENYPELWSVSQKIEGLISGSGIHAGGVIFVDEPFTKSTALMKAPDGTVCTQFELHDCESVSLIKYDALSVEAMDKLHVCIDLLCDNGYAKRKETLKETYENIIGIYNIERDDPKMWKMVWDHKIHSLFQMEQQSGIQGIAVAKPKSVNDLAVLNSVIRLMAPEKGAEQPLDMWARYRKDINQWVKEMRAYGLSEDEIEWLSKHDAITDGVCESQEGLMSLVQEPRLGGNSLSFADKCRKGLAKKIGAIFDECEKTFYANIKEKGCSEILGRYVWEVLLKVQRGYSFNRSHCLAYSLIALQEMNLAFKFPTIFWNCACLISDSGGTENDELDEDPVGEFSWDEPFTISNEHSEFDFDGEEVDEEDEDDGDDAADLGSTSKKKSKTKTTDYDKVAKALGQIQSAGIKISPPDINLSGMTFKPLAEEDKIIYGIKGITRIGDDLIKDIIAGRPYQSLEDFLSKVKVNKLQAVNLIKSGAFDSFGAREDIMKDYILSVSDQKKRLTLQNMAMLIEKQLLPPQLQFETKVFNFNKYLKKNKDNADYVVDEIALRFYEQHYDMDLLFLVDDVWHIKQTEWDKIYKKAMDPVRDYLKTNGIELLKTLNNTLYQETYNKYASGNLSKWEMDSICFYHHEHELAKVNNAVYEFANFHNMPEEPMIEKTFPTKDGKTIPIYKTFRFAGTVLGKDKNKGLVTILTTSGVVSVRIFKAQFAEYDKQISRRNPDGTKTVIEKSWFQRGNKIILNGFRRGNDLVLKKYKNTPHAVLSLITNITDDGLIEYKDDREEA